METTIYIPKKLKVGYQKRLDTYSKKLAYVTYFDDKNKLRKEASWTGWIDKKQGIDEFENVPTEGFVLNRNVGGAKMSWGHDVRIEKVRVYDPRGFEFEIDVPNVLFILQECTSVKGKGLDGTFVYGWKGTSLTLIPTTCQEYKEALGFTEIQGKKVNVKELVAGAVYRTKKLKDLVYLGHFPWLEEKYSRKEQAYLWESTKKHIFVDLTPELDAFMYQDSAEDFDSEEDYAEYLKELAEEVEQEKADKLENGEDVKFIPLANTSSLGICVSDTPVSNYAELLERYSTTKHASSPVEFIEKPATLKTKVIKRQGDWYENVDKSTFFMKKNDGSYLSLTIDVDDRYTKKAPTKFELNFDDRLSFDANGVFKKESAYEHLTRVLREKKYTADELKTLGLVFLDVRLQNNKISKIKQFL